MKSPTLLIFACLLILFSQSCTKCVTCKNECYQCGSATTLICSTDYSGQANWQGSRQFLLNSGCTLVAPTENVKLCDNNVKNIQYLYEKNNYYCSK